LAVTAFEMLTGVKPYDAETALGMMVRHMHDPVPSARAVAPSLPAGVDAAIAGGMAKDPAARPASAGAFARNLQSGIRAAPEADVPRQEAKPSRSPSLGLVIGGIAVVGVVCLAVLAVFGGGLAVYFASSTATALPIPTARVEATAVPTAARAVRALPFADDFSDPSSGFGVQADEDCRVAYADGALQFDILTPRYEWFSPVAGLVEQDLAIEVEARKLEGPSGSEMGILCRWQDEVNYVAAALRNDGMVSVWKKSGGVEDRWLGWAAIPGWNANDETPHRLQLTCDGPDVRFAVDGAEVAAASDPSPTPGSLALMAGLLEPGQLLVTFDQIEVTHP
jgi:hypothetical protein